MMAMLLSLPSPPSPVVFDAGPLALTYYGLFVALGIAVGTWLTGRELARKGYDAALALEALFFVVPLGVAGARIYYVAGNYDFYAKPFRAGLEVWNGGLDIYGALVGGFVGVLLFGWLRGINPLAFADAAAPGLVLAQAVGRWGDYFNQEVFGRPSELPWAIRIAQENRPAEFADAAAFHPAFLYESIWDLLVCFVLLWVARRFADWLRNGDLFLIYVSLYSVGRFFVETLRVDPAFVLWGSVRGNLLVSGVLALVCASILLLRRFRTSRKTFEAG
jgi:phosphatidylglycerol:prolipoprotein diacylglycerol transferase